MKKQKMRTVWSHFDEDEINRKVNEISRMGYGAYSEFDAEREAFLLITNAPMKKLKEII